MSNFFTSSIGKKLIMSAAGFFLAIFLLVHLGINLTLVFSDSTEIFNIAAHFMATCVLIKIMEIVLFGGLILHMIYGVVLWIQNLIARPIGYAKTNHSQTSFFSKYMIHTAAVIGVFLVIHMMDFYFKVKIFHSVGTTLIDGKEYHDLGQVVIAKFHSVIYVIIYIISMIVLGFHLHHAFQSAFQTYGLEHKTYGPIIKSIGTIYSIVIALGFILIPVYFFFIA